MRIEDILDAIQAIGTYTEGMDFEQFRTTPSIVDAVFHRLTVIGEAARYMPRDIAARHPSVEWNKMKGMRNVMVHEYFAARLETVWQTIQQDLPPLVPKLREVLERES